jgi:hypothetical protein
VDSVPDPQLLRKSGRAMNRARTSGSADRNSDHWTTEAARQIISNKATVYILTLIAVLKSAKAFA